MAVRVRMPPVPDAAYDALVLDIDGTLLEVAELHALAARRELLAVVEHGDERYAAAPRTR